MRGRNRGEYKQRQSYTQAKKEEEKNGVKKEKTNEGRQIFQRIEILGERNILNVRKKEINKEKKRRR